MNNTSTLKKIVSLIVFAAIAIIFNSAKAADKFKVTLVDQLYRNWAAAKDIVVSGDYAYVADGLGGLRIVDISDPSNPFETGYCNTPGDAMGVDYFANYAFIADGFRGLRIIDVEDPYTPFEVGFNDTLHFAQSVAVWGYYAYLADYAQGFLVLDINNFASPTPIGRCPTVYLPMDVVLWGNYAYVLTESDGLSIVDIRYPENPVEVGNVDVPGRGRQLAISNDQLYAYVASDWVGIRRIDISLVTDPYIVELFEYTAIHATYLTVSGVFGYASNVNAGLQVMDLADRSHIFLFGVLDIPNVLHHGLALSGQHIIIATAMNAEDEYGGLYSIDISDPEAPMIAGFCETRGAVHEIKIDANYGYVACGFAGLSILDLANPNGLRVENTLLFEYQPNKLAVSGKRLFIIESYNDRYRNRGVYVFDRVNPLVPEELYRIDGQANSVEIFGENICLCDEALGLKFMNVEAEEEPVEISTFNTLGHTKNVEIRDHYVYVADYEGGFRIIDIENLRQPYEIGFLYTASLVMDIALDDHYAYLAEEPYYNRGGGLRVIDIQNPTHPEVVGYYPISGAALSIEVVDSLAFLAVSRYAIDTMTDPDGLYILNISDPSHPTLAAYMDTPGDAQQLTVHNGFVYIADYYQLSAFRYGCEENPVRAGDSSKKLTPPETIKVNPAFPNPFNSSVNVLFELPQSGEVQAAIFSLLGQELARQSLFGEAGKLSSLTFDFRQFGVEVASGLYFLQLNYRNQTQIQKIVLIQ